MKNAKTRVIILVENEGQKYKPCSREVLVNLLRNGISGLDYIRLVDVRVASRHVEFDLLIYSNRAGVSPILGFLEDNIGKVLEVRYLDNGGAEYASILERAVMLFNEERFWEFHETLEPLWRGTAGYEKDLLHALILIAAAFVNYQKCKIDRTFSIFERALRKLPSTPQVYYGINVADVRNRIEDILNSGVVKPFKLRMYL